MKEYLLKIIFVSVVLIGVVSAGQVIAQIAPNPILKSKNSPFSPNPKKKGDNSTDTSAANKSVDISSAVKPGNEVAKNSETPVIQKIDTGSTDAANTQNINFESRSASSKTLDVTKKANAASVSPTDVYKIGNTDVLFISLQNAPSKESNYFTVLNNGTIDYPLAGEMVKVAGLTTEEIEDLLKEKIKLYENPQVSVKIREHNSHTFTVLGLVERPGEKTLQREAVPLYVVRAEAIVQSKANHVTIKRVGSGIQQVELRDPKYGEILIFPGDIVEFGYDETLVVASAPKLQFYYIGGEIVSGGQKDFYQGITLTQAIIVSGGVKKAAAKKVVIRRKNDAGLLTPTEYDLRDIKEGKVVDPTLQAGDTIEISN